VNPFGYFYILAMFISQLSVYTYKTHFILIFTVFKPILSLLCSFFSSYLISGVKSIDLLSINECLLFFWALFWLIYLSFFDLSFRKQYLKLFIFLVFIFIGIMLWTLPTLIKVLYRLLTGNNDPQEGSSKGSVNLRVNVQAVQVLTLREVNRILHIQKPNPREEKE
jgi:hypothetical protein